MNSGLSDFWMAQIQCLPSLLSVLELAAAFVPECTLHSNLCSFSSRGLSFLLVTSNDGMDKKPYLYRILWAFDIAPMKDEAGKLVLPSPDDLTTGLVSQPKPFHYSLNPRRADTIHVIMEDAQHAAVDINSYL